jgi:DNA-binding NarL/FixJ family response regulator
MSDNNRVIVVEDDPYTRDLILNILSRDWRTRIAGQFDSFSKVAFRNFLTNPVNRIDTVILDTEVPWKPHWPIEAFEILNSLDKPPKLIFLCTVPIPRFWNNVLLSYAFYGGYLVKGEILYSIASAVSLVAEDLIVLTQSVLSLQLQVHLKKDAVLIDGTKIINSFTPREQDIIRLGLLFNHSQRDIQDELVISRDWISENLSSVYEKIGLREILSGEISPESIITDKAVLSRVNRIISEFNKKSNRGNLRKAPWLSTLAFHLLTIPETRSL